MEKKLIQIALSLFVLLNANQVFALNCCDLQPRTVTVTASGEVKVVPDQVHLELGIEIRNRSLDLAVSLAGDRVRKAMDIASQLGIEAKNIQTNFIRIDPVYSNDNEGKKMLFYVVRRNLDLILSETAKYDQLVKKCIDAGVNRIDHVQFSIADERKHKEQALELAIKAAKDKAALMAESLGLKIGKAVSVFEGGAGQSRRDYLGSLVDLFYVGGVVAGSSEVGSLALGQLTISASVVIVFELQ